MDLAFSIAKDKNIVIKDTHTKGDNANKRGKMKIKEIEGAG